MQPFLGTRPMSRRTNRSRAYGLSALLLGWTLVATDQAEAQIFGSAGYSASGAANGAGANLGYQMGMSPYDQALLRNQIYAYGAMQCQVMAAQADLTYWAAMLARQQAINAALYGQSLVRAEAEREQANAMFAGAAAPQGKPVQRNPAPPRPRQRRH